MLFFIILMSSFLSSKKIKINYAIKDGSLSLSEELMLSTPVHYSDYEMYVVFTKGELTYSHYTDSTDAVFKAVDLFPIAVIRIKKDNPHIGHDSYSIKLIDEKQGIEKMGEVMTIAEKICYGESTVLQKSLNFDIGEIVMILQALDII